MAGTLLVHETGPLLEEPHRMAIPFVDFQGVRDSRAVAILAKTIYRELRSSGFEARDVMALASELLGQVTTEVRSRGAASSQRKK